MKNLGDEILFATALEYFRRRLPGARFVGFTMVPEDTMDRYGLPEAHPVRPPARREDAAGPARSRLAAYVRSLRALPGDLAREVRFAIETARRIRGLNMLVVPGSSQFIDAYGGPWGFPFALLRWTLLARFMRVPICFLSLGAERLEHRLSRWMVRRTVHLANYVSVRDTVSRDRLLAQGIRRALSIVPDLSLAYPAPHQGTGAGRRRAVGINPIPYYHEVFWRAVDPVRYRRYLDGMVALVTRVLERGDRVVLYATTQWADRVPAADIADEIERRLGIDARGRVSMPAVHTLEDLWSVLSSVDCVVASRYHGVATALLMRKPVVGVAYEQKTTDFMIHLGVGEYSIPIDEADGERLSALLRGLQSNDGEIRATLDARARAIELQVLAQFEQVIGRYCSAVRSA